MEVPPCHCHLSAEELEDDLANLEVEVPEGCSLTGAEIADLRAAGLEEMRSWGRGESEVVEIAGIRTNLRRTFRKAPSVKLDAPTFALANPLRGRQLMEEHENRILRNGWIANVAGYILALGLISWFSWFCIMYGKTLLLSFSGSAKACLVTFAFAILWHVLVLEWLPVIPKLSRNFYPSVMLSALMGRYTMSHWHEDYCDFITFDIMSGDSVLDTLLKAMQDIEFGD